MYGSRQLGRKVAMISIAVSLAALVSGCGGSSDDTDTTASNPNLKGEPVKFLALSTVSGPQGRPADAEAAEAAVLRINNNGGLAGRPVQIDVCDEGFAPNTAIDCANKAVSGKYTAVIGEANGLGDVMLPILKPAGIPMIANTAGSQLQLTDDLSFPSSTAVNLFLGSAAVIIGGGAKDLQFVAPDVPAITGLATLVKGILPSMGAKLNGSTLLPLSGAVDYSQYAQQAYSKGDGVFSALLEAQTQPFLSAALNQGIDFSKTLTATSGIAFDATLLDDKLKDQINGLYIANLGFDVTDTANDGIRQFRSDLKAVDASKAPNQFSLNIWSGAQLIKLVVDKTPAAIESPAALTTAMRATGPITPPGWVTLDFTKSAMQGPLAQAMPRVSTQNVVVYQVVHNKLKNVSGGEVSAFVPFKPKS